MDILAPAIRNIFYPLWMMRDGDFDVVKYLNHFHYIDSMKKDELVISQNQKLSEILTDAYKHTEYYRRIFDQNGFKPSDFKDITDLKRLPILTKEIIREEYQALISKNIDPKDCFEARTGGSTGVPMRFLRDRKTLYLRRGQELYFDRWMDCHIGDKVALFVASSHFDGKISRLKAKVRNATCERMLQFDPNDISQTYLEKFLPQLIQFRPKIIKCFPNSLITLAHYIRKKGLQVPKVKSISCTGENMYSNQREMFESIFKGDVYEKYGTRESGVIASQCRVQKGLHVFTEGVCVEILREDNTPSKAGEVGRIVLTDLFNRAMPLIRYEIGDMAVQSNDQSCPCGSELPLIEKILGRDRDIVIDSEGNPKPGYLFVEAILSMNKTAQFQVLQPDRESLIVKIAKKEYEDINLSKVESKFKKIVGPDIRIRFDLVNKINRDPSGKYSYVKSDVHLEEEEML